MAIFAAKFVFFAYNLSHLDLLPEWSLQISERFKKKEPIL